MTKARRISLVALAIAGLVVIGGLFRLANSTGQLADWFTALSGWAQAWGGLMAIAAAYAIARGQADQEKIQREEARGSALKTIRNAVEYGFDLMVEAKERLGGHVVNLAAFDAHFVPGRYAAVIETLERAPFYELGMYEVSVDVIRFRLLLAESRDSLLKTVDGMTSNDRRACPELNGLSTQAFNLKQTILHRVANPGPIGGSSAGAALPER